jgi:acyl-CoA synthetase (AMP-forming)/AMP-acid ligase II
VNDPRDYPNRLLSLANGVFTNFFWRPTSRVTVPRLVERWAEQRPLDRFLSFEGTHFTISQFNAEVNRHAHAYLALGIGHGDVVALVLENSPAYLFHFYGVAKIGAIASLINPQLHGDALVHALRVCEPRAVVLGAALAVVWAEQKGALADLAPQKVFAEDEPGLAAAGVDSAGVKPWRAHLAGTTRTDDPPQTRSLTLSDRVAYIYTSGTTGLPKPAVIKHHRIYRAGMVMGGVAQLTAADCIYNCLPLYHASATLIGVGMALTHRCRLVLARRFSASTLLEQCRQDEATVMIYIGELCRYLHNQPPRADDRDHGVRRLVGNGLRADLWQPFCERFGIERVVEFYASTEGNAETANLLGWPGSCGVLIPGKLALVRYDAERHEVLRDSKGRCIRAAPGEAGLLLGAIKGKNDFAGYTDGAASEAKVVRDVFTVGDRWFNSGDLLRRDHLLNLFFVDRVGDTFRWKGENVSTQEVEQALVSFPSVAEAAVYGVILPGSEGRAGMAALVLRESQTLDGAALYSHLALRLPPYAQPRLVRVGGRLDRTETFKIQKQKLRDDGYDPGRIKDPLYYWSPKASCYVPFGPADYQALVAGALVT